MKVIESNLPKAYFDKDRNNRLEARIAKFELNIGDTIRFFEWDEEKHERTGRYYDKKVRDLHKLQHAVKKYWKKEDLDKFGLYIMELEDD